jgi:hypothetical protein
MAEGSPLLKIALAIFCDRRAPARDLAARNSDSIRQNAKAAPPAAIFLPKV